jgi:hypothetical protein
MPENLFLNVLDIQLIMTFCYPDYFDWEYSNQSMQFIPFTSDAIS